MRRLKPKLWISLPVLVPALIMLLISLSQANPREIPQVTNLQMDARAAQAQQVPLLLMFSFHHCPFCAVVREEFLEPMKISGDYEDKVLMRIIDMDGSDLIDFDGKRIPTSNLSQRYDVNLGPTVILVNVRGELLAEPLVGITTKDFYGGYLDEAIFAAQKKLNL
jgi:thioredoxin-related protein